jgi:NADH dehydrogenase
MVERDCSLSSHQNIFVIGDAAHLKDMKGNLLPGIAPVAIQQAKYVAGIILNQTVKVSRKPFKYFSKGIMATIGRAKAVAQFNNIGFSGFFAWVLWSLIHIMYLIGFRNRYMVMSEWFWNYLVDRRGIRLITKSKI